MKVISLNGVKLLARSIKGINCLNLGSSSPVQALGSCSLLDYVY